MPTVNYTFANLYGTQGEGTSSIDLTSGTPYTFAIANNSGSSYFTMETPSNYLLNGSTPKNTSGSFTSTGSLFPVISDYIAGFALPQTSSYSFIFTPATNVTGTTLRLRGTGGITLTITY
jgi:hypothetical protein